MKNTIKSVKQFLFEVPLMRTNNSNYATEVCELSRCHLSFIGAIVSKTTLMGVLIFRAVIMSLNWSRRCRLILEEGEKEQGGPKPNLYGPLWSS